MSACSHVFVGTPRCTLCGITELQLLRRERGEALRLLSEQANQVRTLEARVLELEALFQQAHGCHWSWVAEGVRLGAAVEAARDVMISARPHCLHTSVEGDIDEWLAATPDPTPIEARPQRERNGESE